MKKNKTAALLLSVFLGKRYSELENIDDQVRYMTMNSIFMVAIIPLVSLGITVMGSSLVRALIDYFIAFLCLVSLILLRTKIPLRLIPVVPVSFFGLYCLYLLYTGDLTLWAAVWLFSFPPIVFFLCQMTVGLIESILVLAGAVVLMYAPVSTIMPGNEIKIRILMCYVLVASLSAINERISILKDRKEKVLNTELAHEKDMIQTMKDNLHQGIFLMDREYKILPQYSQPLVSILSFYDSDLAGKNFLDILSSSLDAKQLQIIKGYFTMIFTKAKKARVLESANPISEFEYKIEKTRKTLTTSFHLVEEEGSDPVIIGIVQDITREKEFERELQAQKEVRELEMKNMFDVIQVDPLVFRDFIEDTEDNFNYINSMLQDKTLTERQVITKFFQNVHAIKSNAIILGLENFGRELHTLEDKVKGISDQKEILMEDVLSLAFDLEKLMKEKDSYIRITRRIESFKTSNQIDTVLVNSLTKAVEKISSETQKKAELKVGQLDREILESKLRKPIKEILFQCVRNSLYHGIEPIEDRIDKNKNPRGLLVLTIKNIDGKAEVTFSDDGSGLNWEKIKKKYLVLHPEITGPDVRKIGKNELLPLIFTPEFSTADSVTISAGRGVGLSLVKDLVKENNGSIKVNSTESGLTMKFVFPIPK